MCVEQLGDFLGLWLVLYLPCEKILQFYGMYLSVFCIGSNVVRNTPCTGCRPVGTT